MLADLGVFGLLLSKETWLAGTFLGGVVGNLTAHFVQAAGHTAIQPLLDRIAVRLRDGGMNQNHDLLRALRRAECAVFVSLCDATLREDYDVSPKPPQFFTSLTRIWERGDESLRVLLRLRHFASRTYANLERMAADRLQELDGLVIRDAPAFLEAARESLDPRTCESTRERVVQAEVSAIKARFLPMDVPLGLLRRVEQHPGGFWDLLGFAFREELKRSESAIKAFELDVLSTLGGEHAPQSFAAFEKKLEELLEERLGPVVERTKRTWECLTEMRGEMNDQFVELFDYLDRIEAKQDLTIHRLVSLEDTVQGIIREIRSALPMPQEIARGIVRGGTPGVLGLADSVTPYRVLTPLLHPLDAARFSAVKPLGAKGRLLLTETESEGRAPCRVLEFQNGQPVLGAVEWKTSLGSVQSLCGRCLLAVSDTGAILSVHATPQVPHSLSATDWNDTPRVTGPPRESRSRMSRKLRLRYRDTATVDHSEIDVRAHATSLVLDGLISSDGATVVTAQRYCEFESRRPRGRGQFRFDHHGESIQILASSEDRTSVSRRLWTKRIDRSVRERSSVLAWFSPNTVVAPDGEGVGVAGIDVRQGHRRFHLKRFNARRAFACHFPQAPVIADVAVEGEEFAITWHFFRRHKPGDDQLRSVEFYWCDGEIAVLAPPGVKTDCVSADLPFIASLAASPGAPVIAAGWSDGALTAWTESSGRWSECMTLLPPVDADARACPHVAVSSGGRVAGFAPPSDEIGVWEVRAEGGMWLPTLQRCCTAPCTDDLSALTWVGTDVLVALDRWGQLSCWTA